MPTDTSAVDPELLKLFPPLQGLPRDHAGSVVEHQHCLNLVSLGGVLRRVVTAASGVLAQFGGVTLAFAFIATIGLSGFVTVFLRDRLGIRAADFSP